MLILQKHHAHWILRKWDQDGIWSRDGADCVSPCIPAVRRIAFARSTLEAAYEHLDNMFASAHKISQQMENDVVYYEISLWLQPFASLVWQKY